MDVSEKIADKAHDLFIRYGIKNISMDDIATHLGISKKTIYQFYANKGELVELFVDRETKLNVSEFGILIQSHKTPVAELGLIFSSIAKFIQKIGTAVIYDLQKNHQLVYKKLCLHKNEFLFQIITNNINRGLDEDLYRRDFDIDFIARFTLESVFILNIQQYETTGPVTNKELIDFFLHGVTNESGRKLLNSYPEL